MVVTCVTGRGTWRGLWGAAWCSCLTWVGFPLHHQLLRGLCITWFLGQKTFGRALMVLNTAQGGCLSLICSLPQLPRGLAHPWVLLSGCVTPRGMASWCLSPPTLLETGGGGPAPAPSLPCPWVPVGRGSRKWLVRKDWETFRGPCPPVGMELRTQGGGREWGAARQGRVGNTGLCPEPGQSLSTPAPWLPRGCRGGRASSERVRVSGGRRGCDCGADTERWGDRGEARRDEGERGATMVKHENAHIYLQGRCARRRLPARVGPCPQGTPQPVPQEGPTSVDGRFVSKRGAGPTQHTNAASRLRLCV